MKTFILTLFTLLAAYCKAQDAIYDLSYENRLLLNPAFCGGNGEGVIKTSLFHHNIYGTLRGPFHNTSASIDYLFCETNIAVGMIVQNETQGDGNLTLNTVSPVIGIPIVLGSNLLLSFGLQADLINQNIDWSRLIFSDQISPMQGVVQQSSNTNPTLLNKYAYCINSGFNLIGKHRTPMFIRKHQYEGYGKYKWNIGIALNHIYSSPIGLLSTNSFIPMSLTVHGGFIVEKYEKTIDGSFEFTARFDQQPLFNSQDINNTLILNTKYYFNSYFSMGVGYRPNSFNHDVWRNSRSMMIHAGIIPTKSDNLKIDLCYAVSIGELGFANAFEIGLIIFSPKRCSGPNTSTDLYNKDRKKNMSF